MSQLSAAAPVPVLATWSDPQLLIEFDQQLHDEILDLGNWTARINNQLHIAVSASVAGNTVALLMTSEEADPGPDVVNYKAIPPDVRNMALVPAVEFANFPIG